MAEWSRVDYNFQPSQFDLCDFASYPSYYQSNSVPRVQQYPPPPQAQTTCYQYQSAVPATDNMALHLIPMHHVGPGPSIPGPKGENPRETRNKAEKMRRDRLNQSVAELAAMVPPVLAARRKIDKTTVLRLTAHYLRAHQYVFGDSIEQSSSDFTPKSILKVLNLFKGFLITTTYRGIIVVVSPNVNQYLGYTELDLLGQNLLTITHEDDRAMLREQLMPRTQNLGPNGELLIPDVPNATSRVEEALAQEKRNFVVRLKKLGQRSEPSHYVTCHVEGSLRKSDRACSGSNRCCQMVRRARARSENPCSSGNDVVFIGIVRPTSETFINESALEAYCMEYRTRHSIDGEIIQCESRIALVTGYMTHEVSGVNAMNFMHRDDVRWVIIALREMYDQRRLLGESCYRLITKNGQFIYMRTRGCLEVDPTSRAVTSFVCTNTVVNETEGKQLIKQMKKKYTLLVTNNENPAIKCINDNTNGDDAFDSQSTSVEDPRRLEEVILHLVTNLPSPSPQECEDEPAGSPEKCGSPHRITIIPPKKERTKKSIEKIYTVLTNFHHRYPKRDETNKANKQDEDGGGSATFLEMFDLKSTKNDTDQQDNSNNINNFGDHSEIITRNSIPFNGSGFEQNSETVSNALMSPDMGYFDDSPLAFSDVPAFFGSFYQNEENHQNAAAGTNEEINISLNMPSTSFQNHSNQLQMQPSTSKYSCGTKRPGDFEDTDVICKKKTTEVKANNKQTASEESLDLEEFFNESLVSNDQIEAALNSLDTIDPAFPDLLNSTDVNEILRQIEAEGEEPQTENNGNE